MTLSPEVALKPDREKNSRSGKNSRDKSLVEYSDVSSEEFSEPEAGEISDSPSRSPLVVGRSASNTRRYPLPDSIHSRPPPLSGALHNPHSLSSPHPRPVTISYPSPPPYREPKTPPHPISGKTDSTLTPHTPHTPLSSYTPLSSHTPPLQLGALNSSHSQLSQDNLSEGEVDSPSRALLGQPLAVQRLQGRRDSNSSGSLPGSAVPAHSLVPYPAAMSPDRSRDAQYHSSSRHRDAHNSHSPEPDSREYGGRSRKKEHRDKKKKKHERKRKRSDRSYSPNVHKRKKKKKYKHGSGSPGVGGEGSSDDVRYPQDHHSLKSRHVSPRASYNDRVPLSPREVNYRRTPPGSPGASRNYGSSRRPHTPPPLTGANRTRPNTPPHPVGASTSSSRHHSPPHPPASPHNYPQDRGGHRSPPPADVDADGRLRHYSKKEERRRRRKEREHKNAVGSRSKSRSPSR